MWRNPKFRNNDWFYDFCKLEQEYDFVVKKDNFLLSFVSVHKGVLFKRTHLYIYI